MKKLYLHPTFQFIETSKQDVIATSTLGDFDDESGDTIVEWP